MIKHDPNILQIIGRLHLCDKTNSTPHTIYGHLENEHLLSKNLSKEITLLDVVISTFGFQFKDAINITTAWTMFERSNEVMNVGTTQFTELVLDLLQLLTFDKLQLQGNHKHLRIRHAIDLLSNQPSHLLQRLPVLAIRNRMVVYPKIATLNKDWNLCTT
jgi:hypothetical protein